jgi:hypothetical protein
MPPKPANRVKSTATDMWSGVVGCVKVVVSRQWLGEALVQFEVEVIIFLTWNLLQPKH